MFRFSEEQISSFFLPLGIGSIMLFALFMIGELAYKSNVGKLGVAILMLVMITSMSGFVVKAIVHYCLDD